MVLAGTDTASASSPMRTLRRYRLTFQSGGMCTVGSMAQRIELFSAGCPVCVEGEALVRELAGDDQEVVVHDLRHDEAAATLAAEQGIKAVPAVVVDGRLL